MEIAEKMGYCISIHVLREEDDDKIAPYSFMVKISIHVLREEDDAPYSQHRGEISLHFYPRPPRGGRRSVESGFPWAPHFYPRPPRGGRLTHELLDIEQVLISIHVLREEDDTRRMM